MIHSLWQGDEIAPDIDTAGSDVMQLVATEVILFRRNTDESWLGRGTGGCGMM
jgi:hypothetical protein